jgi:hypothetical protein
MTREKMLSAGGGEHTTIGHLGLTANRVITSSAARAFFSRTVALWRRLVERIGFPITSSMSRASSCCCTVRPRALSSAGPQGFGGVSVGLCRVGTVSLGQSAAERKAR